MTHTTLPHWDMTVVYPGLDSPEFEQGFRAAIGSIDDLTALFDSHGIALRDAAALDETTVATAERAIERYNAVLKELFTLNAYIRSFITTNSRDERAQARLSELQQHFVRLSQLSTRFTAWIGSLDVEGLVERSALALDHAYALRKAKQRSGHLMAPELEQLAAEQSLTGGSAWSKLYSTFTSQITVPFARDGETRELPISALRNMAFDPDRDIRRRAYEAELAAWERAAVPIAAALNSIKGETNTLSRRRGWDSPLDVGLFENNIDRATLDALLAAARESFPDFRRYLRAKARALQRQPQELIPSNAGDPSAEFTLSAAEGLRIGSGPSTMNAGSTSLFSVIDTPATGSGGPALAWYDLFAPVGHSERVWSYDAAAQFIAEQFGSFSARLRGLAERAFGERWIDAEPRAGKVGGAFCMHLRHDESRILANYEPSFNGLSTLAHELGHAYHNLNLAIRTPLQRSTPMTLAETASIFCETIVVQAALRNADAQEQIAILESSLQNACQVVVDITSRFLFEQSVLERRRQRELSIAEFTTLMLDAQRQTYGDGLDDNLLHGYMWAAKPHYYSSTFYNYPYMFGLLFGLGLYARYRSDPEAFKAVYDDLLASTGLGDAADLAGRFGIDIRSVEFWRSSLDVVRKDIERFEALVSSLYSEEQKD